jgi:molybdopterin synthase sulfur carrier subunit
MKVRVKMFAVLRERGGIPELDLELPEGATVAAAMEEAGKRIGAIVDLLPRTAAAVNMFYVKPTVLLQDGDELALIPPVSGG